MPCGIRLYNALKELMLLHVLYYPSAILSCGSRLPQRLPGPCENHQLTIPMMIMRAAIVIPAPATIRWARRRFLFCFVIHSSLNNKLVLSYVTLRALGLVSERRVLYSAALSLAAVGMILSGVSGLFIDSSSIPALRAATSNLSQNSWSPPAICSGRTLRRRGSLARGSCTLLPELFMELMVLSGRAY